MRLLAAFALGLVARMGMGMFRWAFELLYPEIAQSNGSLQGRGREGRGAGERLQALGV